ncbi:hypothetical protein ACWGJV_39280, partial [Streptomyces tendae]
MEAYSADPQRAQRGAEEIAAIAERVEKLRLAFMDTYRSTRDWTGYGDTPSKQFIPLNEKQGGGTERTVTSLADAYRGMSDGVEMNTRNIRQTQDGATTAINESGEGRRT